MSTASNETATADDRQAELADIRIQMGSEYEKIRMTALLRLQEIKDLDGAGLEMLETLATDEAREIRTAANDLLKTYGQDFQSKDRNRIKAVKKQQKGNILLALISFGSASTGLIATILTVISYYSLNRFPFPDPMSVLFWLNLTLTIPYVTLGVLLLFPGQTQRTFAAGYALISLLGSLAAMLGLQRLYTEYWAVQFTLEVQQSYIEFLSPYRVAVMLLPIVLGQLMILYFISLKGIQDSLDDEASVPAPTPAPSE